MLLMVHVGGSFSSNTVTFMVELVFNPVASVSVMLSVYNDVSSKFNPGASTASTPSLKLHFYFNSPKPIWV